MPDVSERLGLKLPLGNEVFTRERYRENLEILDRETGKAGDFAAHAENGDIHVTAEEKEAWSNAKVESLPADKVTAGTLAGKVKAHTAAMAAAAEAQLRDVVLVTADPGAGAVSSYPDGTVILVYE